MCLMLPTGQINMSSGRVDKTEFPLELTENIYSRGRDHLLDLAGSLRRGNAKKWGKTLSEIASILKWW